MSRYRKVEVKTWSDEKFRRLSTMPPSAQGLWLFLMTGPHTGPIPGLFRAGRAAMAEELGWDQEAFDEAFREVFTEGMAKADFKARLMWLPNALKHNKPESPNVVRSWRVELDLLPDCDLKREAIEEIRHHLEKLGAAYLNAFNEISGCGKPLEKAQLKASTKASAKTMPNQEQEQEQEQNKEKEISSGKPDLPSGFVAFWELWPKTDRKTAKAKCAEKWRKSGLEEISTTILAHVRGQKASNRDWRDGFEPAPLTYLNQRRWEDGEGGVSGSQGGGDTAWWLAAGFATEAQAVNDGCTQRSAWMFRDGKQVYGEYDVKAYRAAHGGGEA